MTELQTLECSVQGNTLLVPPASAEEVCARLAARTAQARDHGGPVRIAVRFTRAGIASATVSRKTGNQVEELPDLSIATSDRAMSMQTVNLLADEIARALEPR